MKKKMNRCLALALSVIMVCGVLTACGPKEETPSTSTPAASTPAASTPADEVVRTPINIRWASGSSAGALSVTGNVMGGLLAELYEGYTVSPEVTTGGVENCKLFLAGDANWIAMQADDAAATAAGTRDWVDVPEARDALRYVSASFVTKYCLFARQDDDSINTFEDFKGKKIGILAGTTYLNGWPVLLEAHGMTEADFAAVEVMARPDLANAIQDGTIDCIFDITTENTVHQEAATAIGGYKAISLSDEVRAKMKEKNSALVDTNVVANYYGKNEAAVTVGVYNCWFTGPDMDYQLVYDMLTLMHDCDEDLKAAHPNCGITHNEADILSSQVLPWHPAAEQFYKDRGLIK